MGIESAVYSCRIKYKIKPNLQKCNNSYCRITCNHLLKLMMMNDNENENDNIKDTCEHEHATLGHCETNSE